MGDDQQCYANVTANCVLSQVGTPSLGSGKWVSGPISQANPNTPPSAVQLFEASGKEGAAEGTNGQVSYSGPDGTEFSFVFSVPYSGANTWTLSSPSGTPGNYTYSSSGNQGDVLNFDCTITYIVGQVTGLLTTNCAWNLVGTPTLTGGSGTTWLSGPMSQIEAPSQPNSPITFFESSGTNAVGELIYQGPDGTQFAFNFSQPADGTSNSCTLSAVPGGTPSNYTYTSVFNQGYDCDFSCIINYTPPS